MRRASGRASDDADWTAFQIRPGALFLVGDPKQAIYRFRGADVAAYIQAREAFLAQAPDSVLPISTNFRSCEPILRYVNERFETLLSVENGQPGFTALDPFHPERDEGLCVAALDVAVADAEGKASAEQPARRRSRSRRRNVRAADRQRGDTRSQDRRAPPLQARRHRASGADGK